MSGFVSIFGLIKSAKVICINTSKPGVNANENEVRSKINEALSRTKSASQNAPQLSRRRNVQINLSTIFNTN
jgi:IS30 family transposase